MMSGFGAAVDRVDAGAAGEDVDAGAAGEDVVAVLAGDQVAATVAIDGLGDRAASHRVAGGGAREGDGIRRRPSPRR